MPPPHVNPNPIARDGAPGTGHLIVLGFLTSLFEQRFWILAYICMAVGLWLPGTYTAIEFTVPLSLGGILFFTCLKIPFTSVLAGVSNRRGLIQLGWMVPVKLLAFPMLGWAVTWLIAPEWAPGVALVCLMPVGVSTTALTDLHGGDRVLALLFTIATSLIAPLSVPVCMALLPHGRHVEFTALFDQAAYLLILLIVPFAAAQGARRLVPRLVQRGMVWWGRLAILSLQILVLVGCLVNRGAWADWHPAQLLVPIALTTLACGITFACVVQFRRILSGPELTAFACGTLYLNNGLGLAYATKFYPGEAQIILPCVLMGIPMLAAAALWGRWAHIPAEKPAA